MSTNEERSTFAGAALEAFADACGLSDEDAETKLADLLADLQHWADRNNASWSRCLARAVDHYEAEVCYKCGGEVDDFGGDGPQVCATCLTQVKTDKR